MAISAQATPAAVNRSELEERVKAMYHEVAETPDHDFHFEMGRALAERLGYDPAALDRIPAAAIDSFAGVGHFFDLVALRPGETVLDLGSGSGMDSLIAALAVGAEGRVEGLDMTEAQREKATRLARKAGFANVEFHAGYIESPPFPDGSIDAVISNGVINLSADKPRVFAEAARVLKSGGRLALADIVTEKPLPESVSCNATLWAACIGGALQQDAYRAAIESAGLVIEAWREHPEYRFLTESAQGASSTYGVKSISLLAVKA
ncbi:methyltransferase domain-containing protein [Halomonas sp. M5N1S17]|uniref:methyltransferase domain-containing protein n=1 Tax=Halomonas alkalisoli TaxID=2907158 RepID=UPI001F45471A|nr:methyltransferase domain-containing protein [Halomonas alkalisoli]MCE9665788.1 methyltransferase domain-containing protein [Halomonas alkalisoli]